MRSVLSWSTTLCLACLKVACILALWPLFFLFRFIQLMADKPQPGLALGDRPICSGGHSTSDLEGRRLPIDETIAYLDNLFFYVAGCAESVVPLTWSGDATDTEAILIVFEPVSEMLYGPNDGQRVYHGYHLDLDEIRKLLCDPDDPDHGTDFLCNVHLIGCTGPEITVVGAWQGKRVFVHFCSMPPCGNKPAWLLRTDGSIAPVEEVIDDD